ncbi:MAG: transcriptional regulator [Candidatus Aenigmarchaeota archaeon]|nr:transcriptional regulator [Candidatus Aenigmarchaeota archaeon]
MKPPCENVVKFILPALRALIARDLIEVHKFTQKEVAKMLDMTQPAISQYKKHLRGNKVNFLKNEYINKKISEISTSIARKEISNDDVISELCGICKMLRKEGFIDNLN